MRHNFWLVIAIFALLGLFFVPGQAHSAPISAPVRILPEVLPSRITIMPARVIPTVPVPKAPEIGNPWTRKPYIRSPWVMRDQARVPAARPARFVRPAAAALSQAAAAQDQGDSHLSAEAAKALAALFENSGKPVTPPVDARGKKTPSTRLPLPERGLETDIGIR